MYSRAVVGVDPANISRVEVSEFMRMCESEEDRGRITAFEIASLLHHNSGFKFPSTALMVEFTKRVNEITKEHGLLIGSDLVPKRRGLLKVSACRSTSYFQLRAKTHDGEKIETLHCRSHMMPDGLKLVFTQP